MNEFMERNTKKESWVICFSFLNLKFWLIFFVGSLYIYIYINILKYMFNFN